MQSVLIVTHYFYPENTPRAFRATELANEFARQGHSVTILTHYKPEIHDVCAKENGYTFKDLGKQKFKPIELTGNRFMFVLKSIWRRILLLLFEYPNIELMWLVQKALRHEAGYDLMISIAVPYSIHWGVAKSRTRKKRIATCWVADCGDPFMGCKTDSFKKLFYFSFVEKWFCRKADFLSVPNQDHIAQYYPEFRSKIKIIPQGFKFDVIDSSSNTVINRVPTFAFAGVFLKQARNPEMFLNYLVNSDREFRFVIFTNTDELLKPYIPLLKHKLEIRGFIPRNELLVELSKMDFLVNIEFHSSVNSNSPSKLIDYVIVNRPILSLEMLNPDVQNIERFLSGDYSGKMIIENSERFRIENIVAKFIELTPELN